MKSNFARMVTFVVMLGLLASLFSGCFLKKKLVDDQITDGPGMVNYNGLLLDALIGDWNDDQGRYRLAVYGSYTISLYDGDTPVLENADFTMYPTSADTNEFNELYISQPGGDVQLTKAYHENGVITLELTASDGTKSIITFYRMPEMLDGPGMVYYGGVLDEALSGCWYSADGRFALDFDGKCADFIVDGNMLMSKDDGYFVDHSFGENDDLNEHCELYPFGSITDDNDEPILTIDEMWYQAEQITMNITWPDGKTEQVIFNKADTSLPMGEWETEQTPQPTTEAAPEQTPE